MKNLVKPISAAVLCFTLFGAHAHADWKVGNLTAEDAEAVDDEDGLYLLAENAEGPTIMLGCSDRLGVQARIYLNGMTQEDLKLEPVRRVKTRMVSIDTESSDPKKYPWAYLRTKQQLVSVKAWQGKRLYNAAIKGEEVQLDIARIGDFSFTPPTINDDFKTFASTCTATAPKQS